MTKNITASELPIWDKLEQHRGIASFTLELTARCNNNCRHCYINLPVNDSIAAEQELSMEELVPIVEEAVNRGALWCLITGGEPLLRTDFEAIYHMLKRKGLLVSIFTNATMINQRHIELFLRYPPFDIEISLYGATQETYEKVTGLKGSYNAMMRGIALLEENKIPYRLKAMALKSNIHEMDIIADFCKTHTKDYFRFDPQLHLRVDNNEVRNQLIKQERLSPAEVVSLESSQEDIQKAVQSSCKKISDISLQKTEGEQPLFYCGAGKNDFVIGYNGKLRLCLSLFAEGTCYDIRKGSFKDFWEGFVPVVRSMRSKRAEYIDKCAVCPLVNLCLWCPAHAHLETGRPDTSVDLFCELANARYRAAMQK